jgi:hypothetical protein
MAEALRITVVTMVIVASWVAFGRKLLALRRRPRDAPLRAICLALAGLAAAMTAQFAAAWLDDVTGIANLGRFAGNAAIMVALCGGRLMLSHVTHDDSRARGASRREVAVLALALACTAVLFAVTPPQPAASIGVRSHPVHPIYSSPYVYVYVAYVAYALCGITAGAWRYAGLATRPSTRYGLRVLAASGVCGLAYCAAKGGLLAAYQLGVSVGEWEFRIAGTLYLTTAALALAGLAVPAATGAGGPVHWVRRYRAYRSLFPLWHALYRAEPDIVLVRPARADMRIRQLGFHLYRRVIEIRDGQLALRPYRDPEAGALARSLGLAAGLTGDLLAATVEAAEIAVALDAKAAGRRPVAGGSAPGRDAGESDPVDVADLDGEIRHLERVALQLMTSPIVETTRARFAWPARQARTEVA